MPGCDSLRAGEPRSEGPVTDFFCRCGHHHREHRRGICQAIVHVLHRPFRHALNGRLLPQRCGCWKEERFE